MDVVDIVSAIAGALDHAHERQLLHRDVKPANILIADSRGGDRRILLADFGIARDANDANGLTATNVTVGSVAYAAPEQLQGAHLDGRADQYALACTAFHLLTGTPPFISSNPAVLIGNHLSSPPPRLTARRPGFAPIDDVLARAMAKEPTQRFSTCRAFAEALRENAMPLLLPAEETQLAPTVGAGLPRPAAEARPPNRADSAAAPTMRRATYITGGVVVLLLVGFVAFIGARLGRPDPAPPRSLPSTTVPTPLPPEPQHTVTYTAPPNTVTQPNQPPVVPIPSPPARRQAPQTGDLGLAQPISRPTCDGQGIVILGSVTTPGLYAAGVQRLLDANPGAFYLRTDHTCPSLRPATAEGNPIYAVYKLGGSTRSNVCAAVRAAGEGAYGKWLDTTTDPGYVIPC